MLQLQRMIEKARPDLLTLSTTEYDLSLSHNLFSKAAMRQFSASGLKRLKAIKYLNLKSVSSQCYKASPLTDIFQIKSFKTAVTRLLKLLRKHSTCCTPKPSNPMAAFASDGESIFELILRSRILHSQSLNMIFINPAEEISTLRWTKLRRRRRIFKLNLSIQTQDSILQKLTILCHFYCHLRKRRKESTDH